MALKAQVHAQLKSHCIVITHNTVCLAKCFTGQLYHTFCKLLTQFVVIRFWAQIKGWI